ncbi:30S ribosomal protein S13 [Candidatus Amesbacteria bacterium RIFCSPLOWO2_02_FULL_48_11]|uniref:Small ribosomal subunit protein uS13 n=5 Tax=Candidatus Amesiibacteriota TaxID=1752730 RepID=A0A1F4Z6B0_9BACT|nr:MAG: 30S ribosomal protein S13 [Candidatus Amesbacteria bacterium GW2011_GWA2_47_11]KKU93480.1 MAG: 30S ribosomal protein S13 [Candidatus Amesbacteria bacterium GW2011_GWC1_48_10]KKW01029.1 MAG: 30S ribosomal protein S13 [Candidatus Amesbacteria bacterium GW2011_GWA1_48_9]OGC89611.1 MAG: 30S ribosomal protein S13 [Candidatus Amesbacteria bacterium RBG_19FT_COMBO_48_16]OGC96855.1 MAG: 30S ribosomal protein S13 [Candidatus Amesbacteria bacterium RIFCSPHIGHO2_02_FULL_48_21]OGC97856.1 MAG: 30S 
MPRIAGVDIPENKRLEVALTYIYGVGRSKVTDILRKAGVGGDKRTNQLSPEELSKIQKATEVIKVEGDLRKEVALNISRLKEIGSYRGMRHARGLPVRGQRTRTNARIRRGKKVTIGALKKEALAQVEAAKAEKERKEAKAK